MTPPHTVHYVHKTTQPLWPGFTLRILCGAEPNTDCNREPLWTHDIHDVTCSKCLAENLRLIRAVWDMRINLEDLNTGWTGP